MPEYLFAYFCRARIVQDLSMLGKLFITELHLTLIYFMNKSDSTYTMYQDHLCRNLAQQKWQIRRVENALCRREKIRLTLILLNSLYKWGLSSSPLSFYNEEN